MERGGGTGQGTTITKRHSTLEVVVTGDYTLKELHNEVAVALEETLGTIPINWCFDAFSSLGSDLR